MRRFSFRQRLLLGVATSIFIVFGIGGTITDTLIQNQLQEQALKQMDLATQGIHAMVRSTIEAAVKNYLKGISETNLAYVEQLYSSFKAGEISEQEAKDLAEAFMHAQKIGATGYVAAVDIANMTLAVHPFKKGQDQNPPPFVYQMAQQKTGYAEYALTLPGSPKPRPKSAWMSFFEPWQWVISAAPFRDEYPELVDLAGLESELATVEIQGGGYPFVMDMQGTLLSHPQWKGRNRIDVVDAVSGVPNTRRMIEAIKQARTDNKPEGLTGHISAHIKDPQSDHIYSRVMSYRYMPEMDWIIGVVIDRDQLEAPLRMIRKTYLTVMLGSLLFALLAIMWAVRPITRSVGDLVAAVEKIDGGRLPTLSTSLAGGHEMGRLSDAFSRMAARVAHYTGDLERRVAERTAQLEDANRKLVMLSVTDGLTGLANRRHFDETLISEWARAKRTRQPMAVIMIDVDHFKNYNDCYGHQAGDECLKSIAGVLRERAQRAGDLVARYGGEEFSVVLPNTEAAGAQRLAAMMRQSVELLDIAHEQSAAGKVTISVGVAVQAFDCDTDAECLLRAADKALYLAKHGGRNRVVLAQKHETAACLDANA
jgi:diguanylate cyclase (GGDEF)-like protein